MNLFEIITDINSIKVYTLNLLTFGLTLTDTVIEIKVVVLVLTAIFTIVKIIDVIKGWVKKKDND
jgi:hypothetical protein|tara:strand:- start:233 stop:427 length:195 start_codon:yes stop_codon:yes gene_type:complete